MIRRRRNPNGKVQLKHLLDPEAHSTRTNGRSPSCWNNRLWTIILKEELDEDPTVRGRINSLPVCLLPSLAPSLLPSSFAVLGIRPEHSYH
jgi:hypothetical protein